MNVYQKVLNAMNSATGNKVRIVLNQSEHLAMSKYVGNYLGDKVVSSVGVDGVFSVIEVK